MIAIKEEEMNSEVIMDEKEVLNSCFFVSEEKSESLHPMYFGVSCAFFAVRLMSIPNVEDESKCELCEKMFRASAQLLGLLVWRVQREGLDRQKKSDLLHKLEIAEREIESLKRIRREDARANEKVVSIFASQEQSWFIERKKLRQHVGALMNDLRVVERKKDDVISKLSDKLKEMEVLVESKDKIMDEEGQKRKEFEEKLSNAENLADELREKAKQEAQEHSSELWKHKTAFIELVSNQRQLEAEMGRSLRQLDTTKQELDSVLVQKEESVMLVQKLSAEIVKMRKDLEQKDKILSAMLRKSKVDRSEKQMLLNEIKLSKAKRKQAETETERWRAVSESRQYDRQSLRNILSNQMNPTFDVSSIAREVHSVEVVSPHIGKTRLKSTYRMFNDNDHPEIIKNSDSLSPLSDSFLPEGNGEIEWRTADVKKLESLVRSEAEKHMMMLQQRHNQEIEAFAEQMRLKDEKLESFRWKLLSMELETKRLQSHISGLNQDVLQLRHENMKLESLLLKREEELISWKSIWSNAEMIKMKSGEKIEQETKTESVKMERDKDVQQEETSSFNRLGSLDKEFEEENDVSYRGHTREGNVSPGELDYSEKLASPREKSSKTSNTSWRMDLHALGVSYKIKRLNQQLVLLERLIGKKETCHDPESSSGNEPVEMKDFLLIMCLLNKQVSRYQSLQGKTDDLCQRMHENGETGSGDSDIAMTKGETRTLETFLEETFQLQRYIVASGQKMMEIKTKIISAFLGIAEHLDKSVSFDMKRFADSIKTLFQEVQRGLEVRIARIIGDLEGTLACEGMIRLRR